MQSKAKILSKVFAIIADEKTLSQKQMAREIWKILKEENISPESLKIDDILVKLGLAEKDYNLSTDESVVIYDET